MGDISDGYNYLGFLLDKHLYSQNGVDRCCKSAGRALRAVIDYLGKHQLWALKETWDGLLSNVYGAD